jgi:hypothetical protein
MSRSAKTPKKQDQTDAEISPAAETPPASISETPVVETTPSQEEIARRAYELYLERGGDGNEVEDWLQAERELRSKDNPDQNII